MKNKPGVIASFEQFYAEAKGNKWFLYFAVFCRVALALGFIPSGIVKVSGERFTGLPSNHPLVIILMHYIKPVTTIHLLVLHN